MQRSRTILFFTTLILGLAREVSGAESSRQVTLDQCIQLALQHNLDIRIVKVNPSIAQYNLDALYADYEPDLSLSGSHSDNTSPTTLDAQNRVVPGTSSGTEAFNATLGGILPTGFSYTLQGRMQETEGLAGAGFPFENANGVVSIQMRQPLLRNFWIDRTRLNIQIGKRNVRRSQQQVRQQIINTVTSVELAYYDLIAAFEEVKVQDQALKLAERLLAENKKRVEVGALAPLDEKAAESDVAASKASLVDARNRLSFAQNTLKQLLSDDFSKWQDATLEPTEALKAVPEPFNRLDSWQKGLANRPELLQSKLDVENQGITIKYQKNQLFPSLDLFGTYGYNGSKPEYSGAFSDIANRSAPISSYGAVLSVPLGNRAARNAYRSSKAEMEQLLLRLKSLEQNIMVEIDDAIKQAQANLEAVEARKQARAFAEAALDAEQKKLENGKTTSYQVLLYQRDLTRSRSLEINALASYNKAVSQLARSESTTLERRKLAIDAK